jgi:hypothetical protein
LGGVEETNSVCLWVNDCDVRFPRFVVQRVAFRGDAVTMELTLCFCGQQKRSDTLNENLDNPIPQFSPKATLGTMREETGRVSEEAVRREAKKIRPGKG